MAVNRLRGIVKKFYVTAEENQILQQRVKHSRQADFSSFARKKLLHPKQEEIYVDTSELKELVFQAKCIGNNINQITRTVNQTKELTAEQVSEIKKELETLTLLVQEELKLSPSQMKQKYGGKSPSSES